MCSGYSTVQGSAYYHFAYGGSSDDFVNSALHLTARNIKHTKVDSHQEMNAKVFQGWFEQTLLPELPPRSVIVIDNAPYHSEQWEIMPNKGSTTKVPFKSFWRNIICTIRIVIPKKVT
jgi:hypothetical protein